MCPQVFWHCPEGHMGNEGVTLHICGDALVMGGQTKVCQLECYLCSTAEKSIFKPIWCIG
jgi:hypothetical protein